MATSMNKNSQKSTVGLLLIFGDIISNEQREEICIYLQQALKYIDTNKFHELNDLFSNLIHENEFQPDSQYRQIANTENGSCAGFLYLPNFHTLLNVMKDLFNTCYHVCIIFCGQQIDSNGGLVLSDSVFTWENFHSLFEENSSYLIQDLHLIFPFVSNQWIKLSNNYLQKYLETVQIHDLTRERNEENSFGEIFYNRLNQVLHKDTVNFDIYTKLIPRDSSGTIAFDEPNLYILYGQQGEASLFGIRGFVVLINGGFSRLPSYWNLIRGLQNIDACILTHFDYDVLPGLQTVLHRKTIPSAQAGQSCKPDIGAIFLNQVQRTKIQPVASLKSSSNSKLLVNLTENIDQFLNDIKQLNIDTFDLIKHTSANKPSIEPINLYKKIAFGSLDLYVLHPTAAIADDEKAIANLQKIPIRDQQPLPSIIPLHHWYSSCSLLVWTPSSKSSKDTSVRILYTGACPQTLVFEALGRARHLEILREPQSQQQQQQTVRTSNTKTTTPANISTGVKHSPQKPKVSPAATNGETSSAVQNKTRKHSPSAANGEASSTGQNKSTKVSPRPVASKPKVSPASAVKSDKPRSAPTAKKTPPPPTTGGSKPTVNKDKKTQNPRETTSKRVGTAKKVNKNEPKLKTKNDQEQKVDLQNGHAQQLEAHNKQEQETQNGHEQELESYNHSEQNLEALDDHEQKLEARNECVQESVIENEYEDKLESETHHEQIDEHEQANNDNEKQSKEKDEHENKRTLTNNHEDEIKRPESVSLTNDHNESFIESNTTSPIEEIKSQIGSIDPMTTSFVDGASNTQNPFSENTNKNNDDDDEEMEIIHHDIPSSNNHSMPSIDEINLQGLPIGNDVHSKKPTVNKLSNGTNRTNGPSTSANNTNQPPARKPKQAPSSGPIFDVDVAYIPYHGNEHYVDSEFFRRIRARYYILNAVQIHRLTLESLIDGKQQWENKEHIPVTLVPTFDGDQLRQFFVMNKTRLAELNINILPASTRCNVQYDDEGSPAQRLRFSSINNIDEQ